MSGCPTHPSRFSRLHEVARDGSCVNAALPVSTTHYFVQREKCRSDQSKSVLYASSCFGFAESSGYGCVVSACSCSPTDVVMTVHRLSVWDGWSLRNHRPNSKNNLISLGDHFCHHGMSGSAGVQHWSALQIVDELAPQLVKGIVEVATMIFQERIS